jgi:hypothetical protein
MVAQRLRRKDLQGRTVYFHISDGIGGGVSRRRTYHTPTYDGAEIYHRCLDIIRSFGMKELCARFLAVSVSNLAPAGHHYLFDREVRRENLMKTVDRVNDRFGEWTVYPASLRNATYDDDGRGSRRIGRRS